MGRDLYDIALEHLDQENYGQAIISIERYVDENPGNKNGKLLMAVIYGDLSNYTRVLEILSTISPAPEECRTWRYLQRNGEFH